MYVSTSAAHVLQGKHQLVKHTDGAAAQRTALATRFLMLRMRLAGRFGALYIAARKAEQVT